MKKIFVIFIVFSLFISSLCDVEGCSSAGTTCSACKDGYLKNTGGTKCLYGCATEVTEEGENKGKCATCKTGYKLQTDKLGCLYGCETEGTGDDVGTCATCSSGYLITGAKTCIKGCKTAEDNPATSAKCKTCTTEANLSTDGLSCIANCKTTGHNSEVCSECKDGYTLSTDKASCTAEAKKDDDKKDDDKSSSFGLYSSLLIFALVLLF